MDKESATSIETLATELNPMVPADQQLRFVIGEAVGAEAVQALSRDLPSLIDQLYKSRKHDERDSA